MNRYSWGGSKGSRSKVPPSKRISTPAGQRLSVIMEGSNQQQPASQDSSTQGHRLTNMSIARRLHLGPPPQLHEEKEPPGYYEGNVFEEEIQEPSRFLPESWRQDLKRRGGWKRFALIVLVILAIIIALAVGLGVGLTQKHSDDNDSTPTAVAPSASTVSAGVPGATSTSGPQVVGGVTLGSYSISLLLSSANTSCTANSATWSCYPGVVFSGGSQQTSEATFNWIVSSPDSTQLQISSSNNPFVPQFSNLPMTLVDAGTDNERYTFQTPTIKTTSPNVALTDDNAATECFFNQTTLQGALYTRKPRSFLPADQANPSSPSSSWTPWSSGASFEEVAGGGENVPNCYRVRAGGIYGEEIAGLAPQPHGQLCSCFYMNYA